MPDSRLPDGALRIALLTHSVNPRGGVVHTLELANALHACGHQVTVMAPAAPGQALFRTPRCAVELVPLQRAASTQLEMVETRIAAFVAHLSQRLRRGGFDVFHAQDGLGGNALATLCEAGAIPGFVRTVHHLDHFDDPRLMHWQRRGVERAQLVLCVSGLWRETLWREHRIDAALVDNGVDRRRFTARPGAGDAALVARLGLRPGGPLFVALGGIEQRKNPLRVLDAFVAVRARRPQAQLVIAGGASLLDHQPVRRAFDAALQANALPVGPGQAVVLPGPLPDDDVPALLRVADAVLMPSLTEGFGLVVLEALCCGTPVVVSRIAPFTEYLGASDCCWADPHDAGSIAAAMLRACAPRRAAQLAQALPAACVRHDWTASAARHVALYRAMRGLCNNANASAHSHAHAAAAALAGS